MSLSKSGVLFSLIIFYTILILGMNWYGGSELNSENIQSINGTFYGSGDGDSRMDFIPQTITGFKGVPNWMNAILLSFSIIGIFILLTTILGFAFDGGS